MFGLSTAEKNDAENDEKRWIKKIGKFHFYQLYDVKLELKETNGPPL